MQTIYVAKPAIKARELFEKEEQFVELGKASALTMGNGGGDWEGQGSRFWIIGGDI